MKNYIQMKDWEMTKKILITDLSFYDIKKLYEVYILKCYKEGKSVLLEDFVVFLNEQNLEADLIKIVHGTICANELEDILAEEIQCV